MTRLDREAPRQLLAAGAPDDALDALLLAGPGLVALLVLLGRTPLTTALAAAYVLALPAYVAARALDR
ncbi:MAG: hypothetical protein ABEJ31_08605 [Haloarculaceae archaeon]